VGIIRGLVQTKLTTIGGLIGYFCISLPLACIFAFKYELGVFGLWIGMIFGSFFMAIYYKWLLDHYFDWEKLKEEAAAR
jgi:MATE family multidrug resistance protein